MGGDGQGGLACCSPWSHSQSDMTKWLNWLNWYICILLIIWKLFSLSNMLWTFWLYHFKCIYATVLGGEALDNVRIFYFRLSNRCILVWICLVLHPFINIFISVKIKSNLIYYCFDLYFLWLLIRLNIFSYIYWHFCILVFILFFFVKLL